MRKGNTKAPMPPVAGWLTLTGTSVSADWPAERASFSFARHR